MDKITTALGNRMVRSVSPIYDIDDYVLAIFEANGKVMNEISQVIEGLKREMYPQNATWTLSYWEDMLGIEYQKLPSDDERVQRVLFELNKYFTVTRHRLENIVNTFIDKKNALVEEVDEEYAFTIIIPVESKMSPGLRNAVEEVKPAHLLAIYEQVTEAGAIIITDDTYGYPVFYKACGEFGGEKESGQREVGAINVVDDSYGYDVEYPVAEKQSELVALDDMQLINDTYDYPKFYGVAGEMETLDKFVSTNEEKTEVNGDIYNFAINYPVCGEFHAEGE